MVNICILFALILISFLHFNFSSFGKRVKVAMKQQGCPDEFLTFVSIVFPFFTIFYWMFIVICYLVILTPNPSEKLHHD